MTGQLQGARRPRGARCAQGPRHASSRRAPATTARRSPTRPRCSACRPRVCVPALGRRARSAQRIERYGAELVIAPSDHYDDAEALAKEIAVTQGAAFVSPYDDVRVVLGNGSVARLRDRAGAGGAARARARAVRRRRPRHGPRVGHAAESEGPSERAVWGAQSEASCAMAMSLERGAAVERLETGGTTLAEGLEGGISAEAFARARAAVAGVVVVTEAQIARAMVYALPGPGARASRAARRRRWRRCSPGCPSRCGEGTWSSCSPGGTWIRNVSMAC